MYLKQIRSCKAAGPDGLRGRVLKTCANELTDPLTKLFQFLLNSQSVPNLWKLSFIRPIPKKVGVKLFENFRPVALRSILAKCMERVISYHLKPYVSEHLDVLQFAYKPQRETEDATLMVDTIASHLQQAKAYARVLFIDYTSAFNTMQIHLLLERLLVLGVNRVIIHWIQHFLTDRPQQVCIRGVKSNIMFSNTGAPQGCVLSPLLFLSIQMRCKFYSTNYKRYIYTQMLWHWLHSYGRIVLIMSMKSMF